MGTEVVRYYKNLDDPDVGTYEFHCFASFYPDGNKKDGRVLTVCKSVRGYLNVAFEFGKDQNWVQDFDYTPENK